MTEPDEIDELARRAQAGDRDALEQLLGAIRSRTLNVCRGVLPYNPDAEDACQEALLNIATKIGSWGGRGRFTTWTHVIAVNSARSTYRRMKNQAVASGVSGLFMETHPDPEKALSDGPNAWPLERMESLLTTLAELDRTVKQSGLEEMQL